MSDSRQCRIRAGGRVDAVIPDFDTAYRAVMTRDSRFDGQFVTAVRTTGIYCRPACPARTPYPANVTFYPTSAAAQAAGYRACRRCLPDAAPGSPDWNVRADTVGAAMRLIGDGVVDREGVTGLADRLGYTPRHLGRLLTAELGASPLSLARARRAHTARVLLTTTALPIGDIAFAAGFSSIRQFNETIRDVYATDPTALRARAKPLPTQPGSLALRLPVRAPFAADALLAFFALRAVPGVESVDGRTYSRSLRLPHGVGTVHLTMPAPGGSPVVAAVLRLQHLADLAPAVDRCRRLLDLDADPVGIDSVLGLDPALAASVAAAPGLRLPGAVDGPEMLIRALLGQQVTVAAARTAVARLTRIVDDRLPDPDGALTHLFPSPAALAELGGNALVGPRRRAATIVQTAGAVARGELVVDAGRRSSELTAELVARDGIGPWTAGYVAMRVIGDPDVLLDGDVAVRKGADVLGVPSAGRALSAHADRWRPFRSYAGLHLWRASAQPTVSTLTA